MSGTEIVLSGSAPGTAARTRGTVARFDGRCLVVEADGPLPPGTRVEGEVTGAGVTVRGKIVGAARGSDGGSFLLTVKLVDLSGADRQRLYAEIGAERR